MINIIQLQSAIDRAIILKSKYGEHPPLESVIAQLQYLMTLTDGTTTDSSRLKDINIGLIAAREIEGADDILADMLHKIAEQVRNRLP